MVVAGPANPCGLTLVAAGHLCIVSILHRWAGMSFLDLTDGYTSDLVDFNCTVLCPLKTCPKQCTIQKLVPALPTFKAHMYQEQFPDVRDTVPQDVSFKMCSDLSFKM